MKKLNFFLFNLIRGWDHITATCRCFSKFKDPVLRMCMINVVSEPVRVIQIYWTNWHCIFHLIFRCFHVIQWLLLNSQPPSSQVNEEDHFFLCVYKFSSQKPLTQYENYLAPMFICWPSIKIVNLLLFVKNITIRVGGYFLFMSI